MVMVYRITSMRMMITTVSWIVLKASSMPIMMVSRMGDLQTPTVMVYLTESILIQTTTVFLI